MSACVRGERSYCDCSDELVAILLGHLSLKELEALDRAATGTVLDSITEALERKEKMQRQGRP